MAPASTLARSGASKRLGRAPCVLDPLLERRREIDEAPERPGVDRRRADPRRATERGLGGCSLGGSGLRGARRRRDLLGERRCLGGECASPALELEQDGLCGLAHEPELAPRRVVAEALGRHRRRGDLEQLVERHDGKLRHELLRRASCEHCQASEARCSSALQQREPDGRVVCEHGRRTRPQRGGDRALGARRDVEFGQGEASAVLREGASCRRQAFLLGQRLLERTNTLAHELCALGDGNTLALGGPRRVRSPGRLELETGEIALSFGLVAHRRRLGAEALEQRGRRLRPQLEALAAALEPVPRRHRRLSPTRRVGQLVLGARAVGQQALQPPLSSPLRERSRVTALLRFGAARARLGEVELRDPCAQPCDLGAELLRALGGRRLQRQRAQALAHLVLDVARTLDLNGDASELELGTMPPALELPEPGRLLHERTPVLGPRGEDLLDLSLADDRVHRRAEPDVGEDLDQVGSPHGGPVDEVLAFRATDKPARDRHLREVEVGPDAVLVVEDELDLAVLRGLAIPASRKEDVVRLLRTKLGRRQGAGRPDNRIGDVRLPRAVRPDDDGDARLEVDLERVRERLEAADAERAQVHRGRILTVGADRDTTPRPSAQAPTLGVSTRPEAPR